ncbi:MAG TPA: hypothetical protein VNA12_01640 [Mycobacteriales bacterium]|nr:hypothetical protein [Mycobacteriales bacterium]
MARAVPPLDPARSEGTVIIRAPRRFALATILVAVLGLLAGTSSAASGEGIEISGSSSGWVDIFVKEMVTVTESDIKIDSAGRYAGFYLVPDTATRTPVGALALPLVGAGGSSGGRLIRLGPTYDVAPGGYRLYLIAETSTKAFIPIPNHVFQKVSPRGRVASALRTTKFVVPAAEQRGERRIGVHVRRPTMTLAAQLVTSDGLAGVDTVTTCLTAAGQVCTRPPVRTMRAPFTTARSSVAELARPAAYDAVFAVERGVGLHADTTVTAASLTLVL